jgi:hypothetical protein
MRPCVDLAPNLRSIVTMLEREGCVARGPSGWAATAKGCHVLEEQSVALSVVR